jgi:hypothetical protein
MVRTCGSERDSRRQEPVARRPRPGRDAGARPRAAALLGTSSGSPQAFDRRQHLGTR